MMARYGIVLFISACICTGAIIGAYHTIAGLRAPSKARELVYEYEHGDVFVPVGVEQKDTLVHEFRIANRSNTPLVLTPVTRSCGCVTANVVPDTIPPLGDGAVRVAFEPTMEAGIRTEFVVFKTNQIQPQAIGFRVSANILPAIELKYFPA